MFAPCAVQSFNRESTGAGNLEDEIDHAFHNTTNTGTTQTGKEVEPLSAKPY